MKSAAHHCGSPVPKCGRGHSIIWRCVSIARVATSSRDGEFTLNNTPTGYDYWKVAPSIDWEAPATGTATPKPVSEHVSSV